MNPYPPISDYALIGDCHSSALVSRTGSIDWCCMPRFDRGSCFGRLLDWSRGGYCEIAPADDAGVETERSYIDDTLVLETRFRGGGGEARVIDLFSVRRGGQSDPHRQLLRIVEGERGVIKLRVHVEPRFDYGEVRPWLRKEGIDVHSAIGGDDALVIWSDCGLEAVGAHELGAEVTVRAGQRSRLSLVFTRPEEIDGQRPKPEDAAEVDKRLEYTLGWWRRWAGRARMEGPYAPGVVRSAIALKALQNAPTGAITAAATTSLPETIGGGRNWDYRYSWIRDSSFAARSLTDLGFEAEADGFRRFVQRSSAGSVEDLQVLFGLGGERRIGEWTLDSLEGYRGSRPVRIGNAARDQLQLDAYGELVGLAWRWHQRGNSPDDDLWRFLTELADAAAKRWSERDSGIWEWRDKPRHFVHSKAVCWAALDRALALADDSLRRAPSRRWSQTRDEIRSAIEERGYSKRRGVYVQEFDGKRVDAALLLLPTTGYVAWDDERMVRTTDAIIDDLGQDGLIRRYSGDDGLEGEEGAFLACSFWLVECLARQGRLEEAIEWFDRTLGTASDLGLFAEEYDTSRGEALGNYPQALTHLSHITAALALAEHGAPDGAQR